MNRRAQKVRLGIFIMISALLLLTLIGYFTARRLFEKTDEYYVAYQDVSVSGLEAGSPVKYMGINVGSIAEIIIDPEDVNRIIVRLSLKEGTPVKADASADIVAMGITGLKTIEIKGGSNEADFLEQGQYIAQGTSLVDDISGQAEVIAYKVEEVINNLLVFTQPEKLDKFSQTVDNVSELTTNLNSSVDLMNDVLVENRQDLRQTVTQANSIAKRLDQSSVELLSVSQGVNDIMQGDTLAEILGNLRGISVTLRETNLNDLIENLAEMVIQTQELLVKLDMDMDESTKDLGDNLELLKHTLENIEETSRQINRDPSVLIRGQRAKDVPDRKLK
ncbi:MAG: MlaD family protein [Bacteroidales bacterium]